VTEEALGHGAHERYWRDEVGEVLENEREADDDDSDWNDIEVDSDECHRNHDVLQGGNSEKLY
jgi:hypothetical protein